MKYFFISLYHMIGYLKKLSSIQLFNANICIIYYLTLFIINLIIPTLNLSVEITYIPFHLY